MPELHRTGDSQLWSKQNKRQRRLLATALGLVLTLAACSCVLTIIYVDQLRNIRDVSHRDIPGTYSGDYRIGTELLVLHSDGTYSEMYTYADGTSYQNVGAWNFETRGDQTFVVIDNAFIYGFNTGPPLKSHWKLELRREFFGGLVLDGDDPDDVIRLRKQEN